MLMRPGVKPGLTVPPALETLPVIVPEPLRTPPLMLSGPSARRRRPPASAEQLFRHKVIRLLQRAGRLDEDRTRLLLSWPHCGFSVQNAVTVSAGNGPALEALARYCARNPVSLDRLRFTHGSATLAYLPRNGHDECDEPPERLDARDFVARLLAHLPDPCRHLVHYYGAYSNLVRGKQKARAQATAPEPSVQGPIADPPPPPSPSLTALRRRWAELIRRV